MRNCWKSDSLSPSLLVVYMKQHMAIVTAKPVIIIIIIAVQLFMQSCGLLNQFLLSSSIPDKGLPIGLLEMGFQEYIALTSLLSCILSM